MKLGRGNNKTFVLYKASYKSVREWRSTLVEITIPRLPHRNPLDFWMGIRQ